LLRAPTGSGKSEAVFAPFLHLREGEFPANMVYALPMRTLVDDIADRFKGIVKKSGVGGAPPRVAGHHGRRLESALFHADAVVTTIDQCVGAFACTPLSIPLRHGNVPAGAVASAFLVFDEVHTFEPELALQCALLLASQSSYLGLPFVIMSATMPDVFVEHVRDEYGVSVVEAEESDIPSRRGRRVKVEWQPDGQLDPDVVMELFKQSKRGMIVVCNTVQRAYELYTRLQGRIKPCILLHSRFLPSDRQDKEKLVRKHFGKEQHDGKALLVATQVIEVGLDISCDIMVSEVAPVDALIQRAGRCTRWGGEGRLYIFDVPNAAPYEGVLVEGTREALRDVDGGTLDWAAEKKLVNEVLGEWIEKYLDPQVAGRILRQLAEGAFYGRKRTVAEAVRRSLTCDVALHEDPVSLGNRVFELERVSVPFSLVRRLVEGKSARAWRIECEHLENRTQAVVRPAGPNDVQPHGFYVIDPQFAKYDREFGLVLGLNGESFTPSSNRRRRRPLPSVARRESWIEHSRRTVGALHLLEPSVRFFLRRLSEKLDMSYSEMMDKVYAAVALHDLGKLNRQWQNIAGGGNGKAPWLAHTGKYLQLDLPPHATISAFALNDILHDWGALGDILRFAIAHHHSVRAHRVPSYSLISGWQREVEQATQQMKATIPVKQVISKVKSSTDLGSVIPPPTDKVTYRGYCVLSRLLRFADRIATAGKEDAILSYEEWYSRG